MRYIKTIGFIAAAMALLLFAAYGGGNKSGENKTVSINISPMTTTVETGKTATLTVTAQNTGISVTANGAFNSTSVPGQPDGATYDVSDLIAPCPCEDGICLVDIEKASIKYHMQAIEEEEFTYIVTFDDNGMRVRLDTMYYSEERFHSVMLLDHIAKTYWIGFDVGMDDIEWTSIPYEYIPSDLALTVYFISDEVLASYTPSRLPDMTIAGLVCEVYTGTFEGKTSTAALWNGMVMFSENEEGMMEAQAVTLDVPETAFTKTMDITWLP